MATHSLDQGAVSAGEKPTEAPKVQADAEREDVSRDHGIDQTNEKQEPSGTEPSGSSKQKKEQKGATDDKKNDQPPGGYDSIAVPKRPRGWTIKVTVHKAINLPMADVNSLSSDPYVLAQLYTSTPSRHKEDPPMTMRTHTIHRSTDPEWNTEWTIANVPSSGFRMKMRLYDEDPGNHDDRLGNAHVTVLSLGEGFQPIKEQPYDIKKRSGSWRAYGVRALAKCFGRAEHMNGELFVSVECLGRTPEDGQDGRLYTLGPCWWTTHYSPMLGRITNTADEKSEEPKSNADGKTNAQTKRYNFQANQIQLAGPVPKELYHRFVEFKPWVHKMFTAKGVLGYMTSKALHAQHDRVYHFDRNTKWGVLPENAGGAMTKHFLDHVDYDKGGKIFTYVITLDALWRFTETGKEFGIDMLSKHTMHSDVGVYIAFSGEFFIRRLKKPSEPAPPEPIESSSQSHPPDHEPNKSHPPDKVEGGAPEEEGPKDPEYYELVIDNDSGTYRPNAKLLPALKDFMAAQLPGLHILTLDSQEDAEKMGKMKDEQRARKKAEGQGIVYLQGDDGSSISSSDEDDLDDLAAGMGDDSEAPTQRGQLKTVAKNFKHSQQLKAEKFKHHYTGKKTGDNKSADEFAAGGSSTAD